MLSALPLVVAAAVLLWSASRKSRRYESDVYWRAVPLSRLKYLIAAQCLTGASLVFFFDLLRGGAGKRADVVLLAAIAAPVFTALFLLRKRGTRRVAVAVTLGVLALFVAVPHIDIGHFDSSPQSTFGLMFDEPDVLAPAAVEQSRLAAAAKLAFHPHQSRAATARTRGVHRHAASIVTRRADRSRTNADSNK